MASTGVAALESGRYDVAIRFLTAAIDMGVKNGDAAYLYSNRGDAYLGKGDSVKALADYSRAVNFVPKTAEDYLIRGDIYKKMGNCNAAVTDFARGMILSPDDVELANALAWLRATCPEASSRDGRAAIQVGTKACETTSWRDPNLIDTLAAAYAEVGNFDQAVKFQQQALQLRSSPDTRKHMQERLLSYQHHKPYREPLELRQHQAKIQKKPG